jgi:hypothetical protein
VVHRGYEVAYLHRRESNPLNGLERDKFIRRVLAEQDFRWPGETIRRNWKVVSSNARLGPATGIEREAALEAKLSRLDIAGAEKLKRLLEQPLRLTALLGCKRVGPCTIRSHTGVGALRPNATGNNTRRGKNQNRPDNVVPFCLTPAEASTRPRSRHDLIQISQPAAFRPPQRRRP